jgi:hypothetical protein
MLFLLGVVLRSVFIESDHESHTREMLLTGEPRIHHQHARTMGNENNG